MSHGFSKFYVCVCVCVCVPPPFPVILRRLPRILADFPCILAWGCSGEGSDSVLKHHGNEDHTVSQSVNRSVSQSVSQSVTPKHVFLVKTSAHTQHTHSPHQHTPLAKLTQKQTNKKYQRIDSRNTLACSACSHPLPPPYPTKSCPDCPGKDGQRKI